MGTGEAGSHLFLLEELTLFVIISVIIEYRRIFSIEVWKEI